MIILRGLPGCGKSTYAHQLLKKEQHRWKRVNRDDLRAMLDNGVYSPDNEMFVLKMQEDLIRKAFQEGYDVIVDNTHLVEKTVKHLYQIAESIGDIKVIEKVFNETVKTCLERNALRDGFARVPDNVIYRMTKAAGLMKGRRLEPRESYIPPLVATLQDNDDNVGDCQPAVISDLDGTAALVGTRNPFDASTCDEDLPNEPVIECIKAMHDRGYKILFMSGREDKFRGPTDRFLKKNFGEMPYKLFMRTTNDHRKDSIIKRELYERNVRKDYNVKFILDDRPQVIRMWRYELGQTVFALNDKEF